MNALILKDFYVMWKQTKILLILILVFSCLPGAFYPTFAVVYAAILPYSAMAYDERSKWDQLAAMMPYSTRDIVLSKYALGWLLMVCAMVLCLAVQTVARFVGTDLDTVAPSGYLLGLLAGVLILNITLPLFFRFGVEKGRMWMFLLIILVCGAAGALSSVTISVAEGYASMAFQNSILAALVALDVVTTAISVPLSMRLCRAAQ